MPAGAAAGGGGGAAGGVRRRTRRRCTLQPADDQRDEGQTRVRLSHVSYVESTVNGDSVFG